jgi:hypothetical protein
VDPLRPLLSRLAPLFRWRHWPRLRAALIAFHVVAVVAVACPAPVRGASRKQWQRPSVQAELLAWHRRLAAVGVDASVDELADFGRETSRRWSAARTVAIKPFLIYLKSVGATQGWYMFTAPDRNPMRFGFYLVDEGGAREHVFTLGQGVSRPDLVDPGLLGEHRVRRALFQTAWAQRAGVFQDVCTWFGRHARQTRPNTDDVVCTQTEFQVEHPWKQEKHDPPRVKRTVRVPLTSAAERREQQQAKKKRRTRAKTPAAPVTTTPPATNEAAP